MKNKDAQIKSLYVDKKSKKRKAFTLIELLAVIIILGILMIIAIPAVTKYINDSRKSGYISSAKSIINGASTLANSEELGINDYNTTYYIPVEYINTEKGSKSPYGNFTEAYVGITLETDRYEYFWISNDETGTGIKKLTEKDSLDEKLIESNINDNDIRETIETTGINNREKILILNRDGTWQDERGATRSLNPNGRIEKLDLLNAMFIPGSDFVARVKQLADGPDATQYDNNTTVEHFTRSETEPTTENKQEDNLVSTEESEVPIYAWFENGTIYWWTEDVMPHLNYTAEGMFYGLVALKELDLRDMKTDKTTNMAWMFTYDDALTTINVSSFDTSNVTDFNDMFASPSAESNLTSIIGLENFETSKVTNMAFMFFGLGKIKSFNVSSFDTSSATTLQGMFAVTGVERLDLSNFDTSNVVNMKSLFGACDSLVSLNISSFDTSKVTDMSRMFSECTKLTSLNISNFNTANVTTMKDMFYKCSSLTSLNLGNFNTSKVTDMSWMFCLCIELTNLNISSFDTSKVTDMSMMFYNCAKLANLNVSNFNTSSVTNMDDMFNSMALIKTLNLSNFNTSNVRSMKRMFLNCISLESLNVSSFNTSNVTSFMAMFDGCPSLTTIDVSNFDTSKATSMAWMFSCDYDNPGQLTSIIGLENFNTSRVTDMSFMFFHQANLRTLDLSSFNTSRVRNMEGMFAASNYTTIYVSTNFVTTMAFNSKDMFNKTKDGKTGSNEYVLVGGAGTTYDSSHVDKTYARVDDPSNDRPGYFTLKSS